MAKDYFFVIRPGLNSTFQDIGRKNLYHIGLPFSGAMDKRNYLIANKLAGNEISDAVIEFAFQGPCLKYFGSKRNVFFTGNVKVVPVSECVSLPAIPVTEEVSINVALFPLFVIEIVS